MPNESWKNPRELMAIGMALAGASGRALFVLKENGKHDERYRNAYAPCMHSRGYTG